MTTPPTPPLPPHPPPHAASPLHRALRAATKTPRRLARRLPSSPSNSNTNDDDDSSNNNNNINDDDNRNSDRKNIPFPHFPPSDPSLSTMAISGSPPPPSARSSTLKPPKDLRTRLRNFRPSAPSDRTRRRRDDLIQTLLTFPEYDAATVAALLDQYQGDHQRVRQKLEQARAVHVPPPPISGSFARPAAAVNTTTGKQSPHGSSPSSMGSLHVGSSVAATAPKGAGGLEESVEAGGLGRPREGMAKGRRRGASPKALGTPWDGDDGHSVSEWGGGSSTEHGEPSWVMSKDKSRPRGRETSVRVRREMRNSHPPVGMLGNASSGESLGSSRMRRGEERVGNVSGMKRRRSSWAITEAREGDSDGGVEGSGQGSVSPNSWGSSEIRGIGDGEAGSPGTAPLAEFWRNQSELGRSVAGRWDPSDEDEEFVNAIGGEWPASNVSERGTGLVRSEVKFKRGRGRGKPLTDMETYRLLLNRVERLEEMLRAFMRGNEEERKDLQRRVENGQFEQTALEQRHEAFKEELDENHMHWAYTERYLDVMRREMSHAIGARQSAVSVVVKSTVVNVFYYIMAYLVVPVFAFVIRALRDGYGWVRRKVEGRRNAEEEGERSLKY